MVLIPIIATIIFVAIPILASAIKITREYERGVIFRLGRFLCIKGPGIFFIIPIIDSMVKVDLRVIVADVPKQRVVTKDNVTIDVDAIVYYKVADPSKAIINVEDYSTATSYIAQTTLRDVLGQVELDYLLQNREELNKKLQKIIDEATDAWGIKVTAVTIKDVILPEEMLRAMAKQAEAERERRSRIIMAEGEYQASKKMIEAAKLYEKVPTALRLRELQTLSEIAREKNLIIASGELGLVAGLTKFLQKKKE
ncbi:MAG: slipin family protein [Candidatus Aenigmarchaeota archaeon]|nr:slipin family protein [Candidatus Aenigmarchaeota archaeon]MDW8149515.1 slipin family protein [Candidatus Aenigmarchaeota archaeon]